MYREKIKIKLNSQKGVTAADAVIAMLIILTTVSIIAMVYVNLRYNASEVDRKAGATRIATNIIENMNEVYYNDIQSELDILYYSGVATKEDETYIIPPSDGVSVFETSIPNGYICKIKLEDVKDSEIITKATVEIDYKINNIEKGVYLTQIFEKEIVRECNSPRFSEQYIRQMIGTFADYVMVSDTSGSIQRGIKIICPIKFDKNENSYKLVEDVLNNPIWYSYSNKDWAKVLVLEVSDYNKYIDYETKIVDNSFFKNEKNLEKMYVWIPRFGVKDKGELFGDTYFKYKRTFLPILNSYYNKPNNIINYYVDTENFFKWSSSYKLSFDSSSEESGIWVLYTSLEDLGSEGYYLNQSQYGPMIMK